MTRYIQLAGGLLVWGMIGTSVLADTLSELPPAYAGRLQPIEEISLDNLDDDGRQQLTEARVRLATMMEQGAPDAELAEGWGELGALYQSHLVTQFAGRCYANALVLAPDAFRWVYYAGYMAEEVGDLEAAVRHYLRAHELNPDYLAVTARLANAWLDLNQLDRAREAYEQIAGNPGLEATAEYGLGQIALLQREPAKAVMHFRKALDLQPEANRIHYSLARALRASGESDQARQHLALRGDRLPVMRDPQIESLGELRQGAQIHFLRGMKAFRQHDYIAARDAFARGVERDADNLNARISYARTLYLTDNAQGAGELLKAVVKQDPNNALAWYLLGSLADEAGETDQAIARYTRALKQEPTHGGALFNLANSHYRLGEPGKAAEYYAACLQAMPEYTPAWLPYAGSLLQDGEARNTVIEVMNTAKRRYPEQPLLDYMLIQLQACKGEAGCDANQALARGQALYDQQPSPPHRELLALALAATGEFETAAELQGQLIGDAMFMMPIEVDRLNEVLSAYQAKRLPSTDQLFTWKLLQAPGFDGMAAFRDYLTPRPY